MGGGWGGGKNGSGLEPKRANEDSVEGSRSCRGKGFWGDGRAGLGGWVMPHGISMKSGQIDFRWRTMDKTGKNMAGGRGYRLLSKKKTSRVDLPFVCSSGFGGWRI